MAHTFYTPHAPHTPCLFHHTALPAPQLQVQMYTSRLCVYYHTILQDCLPYSGLRPLLAGLTAITFTLLFPATTHTHTHAPAAHRYHCLPYATCTTLHYTYLPTHAVQPHLPFAHTRTFATAHARWAATPHTHTPRAHAMNKRATWPALSHRVPAPAHFCRYTRAWRTLYRVRTPASCCVGYGWIWMDRLVGFVGWWGDDSIHCQYHADQLL